MLRRSYIKRRTAIKRSASLRRHPNFRPTREFVDKTTGEKRLILSESDWRKMKRQMWQEGRGRLKCGICGKGILRYADLEPDHRKPRGMGGGFRDDSPANLAPSHRLCNREKGSRRDYA